MKYECNPILFLLPILGVWGCSVSPVPQDGAAERSFRFEYDTTISGFPGTGELARVWIPVPSSGVAQTVDSLTVEAPVPYSFGVDSVYGVRMLHLDVKAPFPDHLSIRISMDVRRAEIGPTSEFGDSIPVRRLLVGDRLAPVNAEAQVRATRATAGITGGEARARGIYDQVLRDVTYDKSGVGWGRGDLRHVCEVGQGNCSDFHTLFIAMARASEIPALFEIGFALPGQRREGVISGYHCWAWYRGDHDLWRPVDVSEADKDPTKADYYFGTLCENRVAFSRGRDLILDPPQAGPPLNFFVYPYVEVDGLRGLVTIEKRFRFADL